MVFTLSSLRRQSLSRLPSQLNIKCVVYVLDYHCAMYTSYFDICPHQTLNCNTTVASYGQKKYKFRYNYIEEICAILSVLAANQ